MLSSSENGQAARETPFEDNPFIDGCLRMDGHAPEGQQSIEALDLVFGALEHAGVDARQRKIVWADGKRLSIEHSTDRIHTEHPDVPRHLIETHVLGWLENCAPESYSEPHSSPHFPRDTNESVGYEGRFRKESYERRRRHILANSPRRLFTAVRSTNLPPRNSRSRDTMVIRKQRFSNANQVRQVLGGVLGQDLHAKRVASLCDRDPRRAAASAFARGLHHWSGPRRRTGLNPKHATKQGGPPALQPGDQGRRYPRPLGSLRRWRAQFHSGGVGLDRLSTPIRQATIAHVQSL